MRAFRESGATYALGSLETPPLAGEPAHAGLVDGPTEPADAASQPGDQPIDRDHEHAALNPLDATRANQADHRHGAAPTPTPTPPRQPRRLFAHPNEMPILVRPRLCLDRESRARRPDRQRVDVPPSSPRYRVPQSPTLEFKNCSARRTSSSERAPTRHTTGQRQPMPGRTGQTRARARAGPPRLRSLPRSRQPAARRRRSPSPPRRLSTAAGTAADARSSLAVVATSRFVCRLDR